MNSSKLDEPDYWKDRCKRLLETHEQLETEWKNSEKLLLRVVTRLAAAASGLDALIDPQLTQIRTLLRQEVPAEGLRSQLDGLSETLFRASMGRPARVREETGDVLFRFFKSRAGSDQERKALAVLQARAERGEYGDESALFEALERQLEETAGDPQETHGDSREKPGFLSRLFGVTKDGKRDGKIDLAPIQKKLSALLSAMDPPLALQNKANHLRERLDSRLDAQTFPPLFYDAVDFLVDIKSSARNEQKLLEEFLGELTGKLLEMEQRALGVHALTKASEEGSSNLHAAFADHLANLKSSANSATDVEQLKAIVSNRLEVISSYLSKDREAELKRIKETEKQVDQLTSRLQELEMETVELRTKLRSEHDMALRDCLTGLPNRLAYEERIGQEVARWKRFKTPFCLLVWDVDHFKSVNDRFGHKAGDKALVTIAQELSTSIRETDFVSRFGGEEFVMILSGSDKNAALKVANGIRGKVEDCGFNSQGRPVKITVSCGIAQFLDNDTHEHVFERADHALYQAKSDGRNRCVAL